MDIYLVSLLVQGVGGLFLVLVCCTLYGHRRRLYFLYWTLAWFGLTLCLLLGSLRRGWDQLGLGHPELRDVVQDVSIVGGWWHAALWVFGMLDYRRTRRGAAGQEPASPRPFRQPLFSRAQYLILVGVAAVAVLVSRNAPYLGRQFFLSATLMAVYAWSVVLFARAYRQTGEVGARVLAEVMAVYAAVQLHYTVIKAVGWSTDYLPPYWPYVRFGDFLLETLTAVAMIVVLLNEEKEALRDALERLTESEDHFRLVFEHSGVGMALLTPDGRFIQVNPSLIRFLGYAGAELQGRRVADLLHPDFQSNGQAALTAGPEHSSQFRSERERCYRHKGGQAVWARLYRVPLYDPVGKVRYVVAVFVNITERRQAQKALEASEQRYRLRFQNAFDGVYSSTENGTFVDANPAFCRMLGYSADEIQQLAVTDLAVRPAEVQRHLTTLLTHGGDRLETRLRRKDGTTVDVEVSSGLMTVEGHRLIHSISRDISERKTAEEVLRRAEETLREERDFSTQVLETVDVLIVVLDPEGRIVRLNGKCAELAGYRQDELRGRYIWDFLLPDRFAEAVKAHFRDLVERRIPSVFENPWVTRTGEERLIAWRNTTVQDAHGALRYVIGTGVDVTDQRRLEDQLRQAQKMETLGTLVGGIAHDFNNHLTVILGNLGLVLADLPAGSDGHRELADAERAAQRCADMTRGLLTFSRRRISQPRPVFLNQLVAEVARLLQRLLPATIRIDVQAQPDLWTVHADSTQLHQVLMNLAVNARDAMPDGGTLTLATANQTLDGGDCARNVEARRGRFVVLTVRDTGVGIAPDVRDRIFDPFFTTKDVGQGTGLGLAVVFGIVKAHRGWITVASEPGQGCAFHVYLPAAEVPAEPTPETAAVPVAGGHETILVVDDEDLVRSVASSILTRRGFQVLTAADGQEALAIYRDRAGVDLVLLDMTMPRLSGMQVFEQLQQINPEVRVLFSSGHTPVADRDHLIASALPFVAKPYVPDELVRTIRQTLDQESGVRSQESEKRRGGFAFPRVGLAISDSGPRTPDP